MTCEKRGKKRYYYAKIRQGDAVRSLYLGRGRRVRTAVARANADRLRRRARRRGFQAETDELDGLLRALAARTADLVRAMWIASGYHFAKGQWRKKRRGKPRPG